jgi:hypothetical protein
MRLASRGHGDTGDLSPDCKGLGSCGSVFGGSDVISAEVEEVVDLIMSREEALHLTS